MNPATLAAIQEELVRQDAKWGSQRALPARTWGMILGEEFGEVCQAINERDAVSAREELVQVAAVAIQAIDSLDGGGFAFEAVRRNRPPLDIS